MHIVGFIVGICHDARSHERKKKVNKLFLFLHSIVYSNSIYNE